MEEQYHPDLGLMWLALLTRITSNEPNTVTVLPLPSSRPILYFQSLRAPMSGVSSRNILGGTTAVGRVLTIPELLDFTIDALGDSPKDLKSCARVAKLWTRRAQYLLFRKVTLSGGLQGHPNADMLSMWQLAFAFVSSPHLALLIRSIDMSLVPCALAMLSGLKLPNLLHLKLRCTTAQATRRFDAAVMSDVQRLVNLPTLRSVMFSGAYPSIPVLNEYFAHCSRTRGLNALGHLDGKFTRRVPNAAPPPGLRVNAAFVQWFPNPASSSRCLGLVYVAESDWPLWKPALTSAAFSTIRCVILQEFTGAAEVDLTGLPRLQQVTVILADTAMGLPALVTALARLQSPNGVQTVKVRLDSPQPENEAVFRSFDRQMCQLGQTVLPALFRVQFEKMTEQRVSVPELKSWLPKMVSRGWVVVSLR